LAATEPVHHTYSGGSMWNFKAHQANEDDALVASVMGDVTGSSGPLEVSATPVSSMISSSRTTVQSSALSGDMATFGFGGQHSMANAEAQEEERSVPTMRKATESFNGMPTLDWGSRYAGTDHAEQTQPQPAPVSASMSQQTSSLATVAQPAPQPSPVQNQASNPYLNGIDFSGDISAQTKKASLIKQKLKTRKVTAEELANNPYLQGINFGGPAPAAQPQVEAPKPEVSLGEKSSYLDQIGFPLRHPHRHVQEVPKPPQALANPLTEFSWHGEDQIAAPRVVPVETTMMQKVEEGVTQAKFSGPLTDWLAPDESAPKNVAFISKPISEQRSSVDPMAIDKYNDWVRYGN